MIRLQGSPAVEVSVRDTSMDDARSRAFTGLVDRHVLDEAYRYATLLLGDRADAEDATHDAALAAWRRFSELRDPARFDAWFGRILVNACRDRLRARRRTVRSIGVDDAGGADLGGTSMGATAPAQRAYRSDGTGWGLPDLAEATARRDALAQAIRRLSPDHREVVVLRFYLDLTVDQIAQRTGVGAGTVKSRLHYALRQMRDALGAADEEVRDAR